MKEQLERLHQQHLENYKAAVLDTIVDNTNKLIQEDLMSLFQPPLDSMNILKMRFLNAAKDQGVVLSTDRLNQVLDLYYQSVLSEMDQSKELRLKPLFEVVDAFEEKEDDAHICLSKELIQTSSSDLLMHYRDLLHRLVQDGLIDHLSEVVDVTKQLDPQKKQQFYETMAIYLKQPYPDQMIELMKGKVEVKDHILENRLGEHTERYLFTKKKSHLLEEPSKGKSKTKEPKSFAA